jgi:hypothetical protein
MKNGVFWDVTPCGSCKNQEPHGVTSQKTSFSTGKCWGGAPVRSQLFPSIPSTIHHLYEILPQKALLHLATAA